MHLAGNGITGHDHIKNNKIRINSISKILDGMNMKPPGKKSSMFSEPCTAFPGIFHRRAVTMIRTFFILLLIPVIVTSCTTLPPTDRNISGKNSDSGSLLLAFYHGPLNHLNGVRRGQCPMYPSCSRYCYESLKKHGFLVGWMMTCDRLMRCGRDELALAPKININGRLKCYDPVARNDWWWYDTRDRPQTGPAVSGTVRVWEYPDQK